MENSVIIDKSKHWSILLYKEAFHIHRQKPILNYGTKDSKELTRKVKVISLPETIKEKSTFRAKALRRELALGIGENHACFYMS